VGNGHRWNLTVLPRNKQYAVWFEVAASKEAAFFLRVAKDEIHGSDTNLLQTLFRIATRARGIGTVAGGRHELRPRWRPSIAGAVYDWRELADGGLILIGST
jgi:hypothetical protein